MMARIACPHGKRKRASHMRLPLPAGTAAAQAQPQASASRLRLRGPAARHTAASSDRLASALAETIYARARRATGRRACIAVELPGHRTSGQNAEDVAELHTAR